MFDACQRNRTHRFWVINRTCHALESEAHKIEGFCQKQITLLPHILEVRGEYERDAKGRVNKDTHLSLYLKFFFLFTLSKR